MDDERYSMLIESIYDAALNPELWSAAVANLKDEFNSIAAGLFIQTEDRKLDGYFFEGLDPEQMDVYGEHSSENNPWFSIPGLMKPGWCLKQDYRHAMDEKQVTLTVFITDPDDRDMTSIEYLVSRSPPSNVRKIT